MSNEKQLLFFCEQVNEMAIRELLNNPIKSLDSNPIKKTYYGLLLNNFKKISPYFDQFSTKTKASELIQ